MKKDNKVIYDNETAKKISKELENNPEYSLDVDPTHKYNMSDIQKTFIKYYCEYHNISIAAELAGCDKEMAKQFYLSFSSQEEIKRINRAMYARQFSDKILSLDQIGSYLTNLITEGNLFEKDKLMQRDKLKVIELLIDLQKYKNECLNNPITVMNNNDIEDEVKHLSIDTIKQLLNNDNKNNNKWDDKLSAEENAVLNKMNNEELLKLLDDVNKGKDK